MQEDEDTYPVPTLDDYVDERLNPYFREETDV